MIQWIFLAGNQLYDWFTHRWGWRCQKKIIDIYTHKERHLSIDMKTKIVQHVPRINISIWHMACDMWQHCKQLPYSPGSTDSRYKVRLRSMSLSPAINDMCRYWGEIWRQLEILLLSPLTTGAVTVLLVSALATYEILLFSPLTTGAVLLVSV